MLKRKSPLEILGPDAAEFSSGSFSKVRASVPNTKSRPGEKYSPTVKRSRRTPAINSSPIPFPLPSENSNVSCDIAEARGPVALETTKQIRLFPPKQKQDVISVEIGHLFGKESNKTPVALIFYDPFDHSAFEFLDIISQSGLGSKFFGAIAAVTNKVDSENTFNFPVVEDDSAYLAKQFRVLHPLGGGRVASNCILLVDSGLYQRGLIPMQSVQSSTAVNMIEHTLKYLWWEQNR